MKSARIILNFSEFTGIYPNYSEFFGIVPNFAEFFRILSNFFEYKFGVEFSNFWELLKEVYAETTRRKPNTGTLIESSSRFRFNYKIHPVTTTIPISY